MKMAELSHYDADGRVTAFLTVPESMVDLQMNQVVYGRADPATEYVLDRTIALRPACPAVLDGLTLSGIVVPSTLFINDQPFDITEQTVALTFNHPGTYRLRLVCWPYIDGSFTVER